MTEGSAQKEGSVTESFSDAQAEINIPRQYANKVIARRAANVFKYEKFPPLVLSDMEGEAVPKEEVKDIGWRGGKIEDQSFPGIELAGNRIVFNAEDIEKSFVRDLSGKQGIGLLVPLDQLVRGGNHFSLKELGRVAVMLRTGSVDFKPDEINPKAAQSDFNLTMRWLISTGLQKKPMSPECAGALGAFFAKRYSDAFGVQALEVIIPDLPKEKRLTEKVFVVSPCRIAFEDSLLDDNLNVAKRMKFFSDVLEKSGAQVISLLYEDIPNVYESGPDSASFHASYAQLRKRSIKDHSIFTRDRAVIIGDTAYFPDILLSARKAVDEELQIAFMRHELERFSRFLETFTESGIKSVVVQGAIFEGGNVLYDTKSNTVIYSFPEHQKASGEKFDAFMKEQGFNTLSVKKTLKTFRKMKGEDKVYYHLDTALGILPDGEVVWVPKAFDKESQDKLSKLFDGRPSQILTPDSDSKGRGGFPSFVSNMIAVGRTVLISDHPSFADFGVKAPEMKKDFETWFRKHGYTPIFLSDYMNGETATLVNAGPHCMANTAYPEGRPVIPVLRNAYGAGAQNG